MSLSFRPCARIGTLAYWDLGHVLLTPAIFLFFPVSIAK
jgi:hypothetical protein